MLHQHVAEVQSASDIRAVYAFDQIHGHAAAVYHGKLTLFIRFVFNADLQVRRVITHLPDPLHQEIPAFFIVCLERVFKSVILKPQGND